MADRFPSLDEIDAGKYNSIFTRVISALTWDSTGQTEARGEAANFDLVDDSGAGGSSFLDRERAALGDDAAQFATAGDNAATVQDADEDDLLGGGGGSYQPTGGEGMDDIGAFEGSFPAIDTQNEVRFPRTQHSCCTHKL